MFSALYPSADGHFPLRAKIAGADPGGGTGGLYAGIHAQQYDPGGGGERGIAGGYPRRIPLLYGGITAGMLYGQHQFSGDRADHGAGTETLYSESDAGELRWERAKPDLKKLI